MNVLCLIPARSGSRGLRGKNLRRLGDKTLLQRAIERARASVRGRETWRIVVSTNSRRYAAHARRHGADVLMRPPHLATATSPLWMVVRHALSTLVSPASEPDLVVLLSVTTPFVLPRDVRRVIGLWRRGAPAVATVVEEDIPDHWRFRLVRGRLVPTTRVPVGRRQNRGRRLRLFGGVYAAAPAFLRCHKRFVAGGETRACLVESHRAVDIEDVYDLIRAEALLASFPSWGRYQEALAGRRIV